MTECYADLRAVVLEDADSKSEIIQHLLGASEVSCLGRLASMGEIRAAMREHRSSGGASGMLAKGNLFFVDGNLSAASSNGRDGSNILVAFAEWSIALPASYLEAHRGGPLPVHGIAFGCSRDLGDASYGRAMLGYNLDVKAPDAEMELQRMLDLAVELLPATTQ
jgi:hypothetical protein